MDGSSHKIGTAELNKECTGVEANRKKKKGQTKKEMNNTTEHKLNQLVATLSYVCMNHLTRIDQ